MHLKRKLTWDPVAERFRNDDEANDMAQPSAPGAVYFLTLPRPEDGLVNRRTRFQNSGMNTSLYEQAVGAHQRGQLGEAERLYLQLLQAAPDAFAPRHLLGVVRAQQGRHAEALEMIGQALRIRPDVPEALLNYGNVLKNMGRFDAALAAYDRALAVRPDFTGAMFNKANAYREMKRPADAARQLRPCPGAAPRAMKAR